MCVQVYYITMYIYILFLLICDILGAVLACSPVLKEGSQSKKKLGSHIYLKCDIATCDNVSRVIFEKKDVHQMSQWKPVFEGIDQSRYTALDTDDDYTLKGRNDYIAFQTYHELNVRHLTIKDTGLWRCVSQSNHRTTESNSILLSLPLGLQMTPKMTNLRTLPRTALGVTPLRSTEDQSMSTHFPVSFTDRNTTSLFQTANPIITQHNIFIVTKQSSDFTCTLGGFLVIPDVLWRVNGADRFDGIAYNTQHEDGHWLINNTISLTLEESGMNNISCIINSKTRKESYKTQIKVTVKENAKIQHPENNLEITVNASTPATLNCIGTGYKPKITWKRNGEDILDKGGYMINKLCKPATCVSSITHIPVDLKHACMSTEESTHVYTCVILLDPPYNSMETSPNMTVRVLAKQCKEEYLVYIICATTLGVVMFVSLPFAVALLLRKKKKTGVGVTPEYAEIADILPTSSMHIQIPRLNDTGQEYTEITSHPVSSSPSGFGIGDQNIHCGPPEVEEPKHNYDMSSVDIEISNSSSVSEPAVYKRIDNQGRATYVTKEDMDVAVYKNMNRQGRATYVTKKDMNHTEYIQMEHPERLECNIEDNVNHTEYEHMEHHEVLECSKEANLNQSDYMNTATNTMKKTKNHSNFMNTVTSTKKKTKANRDQEEMASQDSPTYINNEISVNKPRRKYSGILLEKPDFDIICNASSSEDVYTNF